MQQLSGAPTSLDVAGEATVKRLKPAAPSRRTVIISLVSGILLIIAAASSTIVSVEFNKIQLASRSGLKISDAVNKLKINLVDAETGQRGYLLTENPAFLEPYDESLATLAVTLPSLKMALAGDASQLERVSRIEALWTERLAILKQTISLVQAGNRQLALERVKDGTGKALMDEIRANLDAISTQTAAKTMKSERRFADWYPVSTFIDLLALIVALFVGFWQISRARRFEKMMRMRHADLATTNIQLENMVAERTGNLENASALLKAVTFATTEAIYAKDRKGRMIFANSAVLGHIGRMEADVLGKDEIHYHHNAAEARAIMEKDQEIMATGVAQSVEEFFTTPQGRRVFLSQKAPLKDSSGTIMGIVGVSTDITERKILEGQRDKSERRYRAAIAAVNGVVWTANPLGEITGEHPEWTALTGQTQAQYQGYGWTQMIHPDDVGPTLEAWQQAMAEKSLFVCEYRLLCLDCKWHDIAVRAMPVVNADGQIEEWVGLNIDISGQKDTQRQLKQSFDRVDLALDAANIGAWEYLYSEHKLQLDARTAEIWGVRQEGGYNIQLLWDIIHPEDLARVQALFVNLANVQENLKFNVEHRILAGDGAERWLATSAKVTAGAGPARIIGTVRDITGRVRQEQRVEFLMQELSHRTKNSLSVIQAIARSTIKKATSLESFQSEFQSRLHSMAQSLDLLVKHNWEGIAIIDLIKSQLDHHLGQSAERISLQGPSLYLKTEAAQNIGLALHELSTNAAKYGALSNESGRVAVTWSVLGGRGKGEMFCLLWQETDGPVVTAPASTGFGHRVIQRVVRDALSGTSDLAFEPGGVRWQLKIPASHVQIELSA